MTDSPRPSLSPLMPDLRREPLAAKVPEITVVFWVIKVLTTGMGEAASDFLGNTSIVLGGLVGVGGFAVAMWRQLRAPSYDPVTYWTAVAMVAVFGTIAADALHIVGLGYGLTTPVYAGVVGYLFWRWHRDEGTLSIHSITTSRRELYYWATVLATFALGTAAGDLTGLTLGWGFFSSGLLFTGAIAVPLVAWRLGLSPVVAFWTAYVLTRPLGASFADWIGKEHSVGGGLAFGDGSVTVLSLVAIAALVGYVATTGTGVQQPAAALDPA
jgi:uncharacterized membrane-anchored protein